MTSISAPVFRVLEKLRDVVIAGELRNSLKWDYDYGSNYQDEDAALRLLETRGVISTLAGDTLIKVKPEGNLEYRGATSPNDVKNWSRHITSVNTATYELVCSEYGLDPYHKTYAAKLEIIDETVPVVTVGGRFYKLPALHSGKATDIILYAYKQQGRSIPATELREVMSSSTLPNIKDTLRAGQFAPSGLLSPFATTSPHSITLTISAQLDDNQFSRISSHLFA